MFIAEFSDTQRTNSVSTRPSKVRGVSLPQEYELARLIQYVENQDPTWSTAQPACKWRQVRCNGEKEVEKMYWSSLKLCGQLQLSYLPLSTRSVDIADNKLTETVDLTHLPEAIRRLNLSRNRFLGEADLMKLPNEMEELYLIQNQFSGNICLTQLPRNLRSMALNGNQFEGTLDLEHLPFKMESLFLEQNRFRGAVILDSLPQSLRELWLNSNKELCGTINISMTQFAKIQNTKIVVE